MAGCLPKQGGPALEMRIENFGQFSQLDTLDDDGFSAALLPTLERDGGFG